jgi:peptide/nickel transport system permease protein
MGRSPINHIPVWDRISAALPVTLSLALISLVLAVALGVVGGTWAALRRGRFVDRAVTAASAVIQAVPPFLVGLALVIFFAVDRSWLPATGYVHFGDDPWEWFRHLLLPAFTLALASAAELARQTRGAMVDTLEQDHIRATRAKGLPERWVIGKHAAKNAAPLVVTVLGLQVGRILGGAVVVELIFVLPGFGALALSAVGARDVVLIQGVVLVSAVFVLVANLAVDVSYGYFNPKTRV